MLDVRHDLRYRCGVNLQLVGDQYPRRVTQALEELAEKAFCRLSVTSALHENVEHMAILNDCTPQIIVRSLDG